ncbi:MAG TPA: aminoglycoside phosphotransferase family protein [Phycisphaerales bacterium]|nr:aminoglycoside phosphotransferase family protein [Phycisphaerales bacterium]
MNTEFLSRYLEQKFGCVTGLELFRGEHAHSQVFRVSVDGPEPYFLKVHRSGRGYQQELAFYQQFAPALTQTPQLVDSLAAERVLLLTAVEGVPCSRLLLADRGAFHLKAGQFLRELHSLPVKDDDLNLVDALLKRLERFAAEAAEAGVKEAVQDVAIPLLEHLSQSEPLKRVPCHRDYAEHNWLGSNESNFRVIDFEHFRADYFLLDLCQMKARSWASEPGLERAFFTGYGRELSEWEARFLHLWSLLWSYSTVFWSRRHGDRRYERLGLQALRFLQGK